ncbi:MAG TPA: ROK family protein [Actinomycetota bacterium]|nr:ROK family protein [Actinomycetota bacterium]
MSVVVGLDVGGTKIQAAALRGEGVVSSFRTPTPLTGARDVRRALVEALDGALGEAGADRGALDAVGLAMPGAVDRQAGSLWSAPNLPGFQSATPVPIGPSLSRALDGVPVALGNDASLAMLGEHRRGAARGYGNVLGVWVGTGVGGGLILNGELFEGHGAAGEIGHMTVEPAGRLCGCGGRGHLESYAGRGRMEARARELAKKGRRTTLFKLQQKKGKDRVTSGVWLEAMRKGDRIANMLIDEAVWALGLALSSVQNLLDLEAMVIGGGLGDRLGQPFIDRIAAEMAPLLFVPGRPPVPLPTEFKDLSGAVGAAVLAGG